MSKTNINIDYFAKLAGLRLTDREKKEFTADISSILNYLKTLQEIDVKAVEPLTHIHPSGSSLRRDQPHNFRNAKDILLSAPKLDLSGQWIVVPRVIPADRKENRDSPDEKKDKEQS